MIRGLTPGRIVHFVLPNYNTRDGSAGFHRPAIVVHVYEQSEDGNCCLKVFSDLMRDSEYSLDREIYQETAVKYSEDPKPFTWHFIEKVD